MTLLEDFAASWAGWGLKIEGERISDCYGFIAEFNGQLWMWTHSYSPRGHKFFPILHVFDEIAAIGLLIAE